MANTGDVKPKPGHRIILIELPPGFLHDLPQEDQQAIEDVLGKPIRLMTQMGEPSLSSGTATDACTKFTSALNS
jgi:hypothetical protein